MRIVYLHGFASSPQSSKARFFAAKFEALGVPFTAPELDEGNFEGLTISGQLKVIERAIAGDRVVLMGSSLGGYLAALYAARSVQVDRIWLWCYAARRPSGSRPGGEPVTRPRIWNFGEGKAQFHFSITGSKRSAGWAIRLSRTR